MSRKRRLFDIDPPTETISAEADAATQARRGPMAAAVRETAAALDARIAVEAAVRAENDALAAAHVEARRAGLLLTAIDPDAVDAGFLHRDRAMVRDAEIDALKDSIRDLGLSNPIRVAPLPGERFALIQGWRRLVAWRELRVELSDPAFDRIPAAVGSPDDALTVAYRRMVDENLVRRDISFAEMATLAQAYANLYTDGDIDASVASLFRSASYQKRSYIRAFVELISQLGDILIYPTSVPRDLGLAVRRRLGLDPEAINELRHALLADPDRNAAAELAVLRRCAEGRLNRVLGSTRDGPRSQSAVTVRLKDGSARIAARGSRAAIRSSRDISAAGADRLSAALEAFFRALDEK